MGVLIALLSTGKGTWGEVGRLVNAEEWDEVYLVTTEFGKEKFTTEIDVNFILIDRGSDVKELSDKIKEDLTGKIQDTEVALNLSSGSGKEHMAVLSGIMKLGLGIRLVSYNEGLVIL